MVEMKYFDKYAQLVYSGKIRVCELTMKSIKRVERYKEQYIFKQELTNGLSSLRKSAATLKVSLASYV